MLKTIIITAIVLASAIAFSAEKKQQRIPVSMTFTDKMMVSLDNIETDDSAGVVVGNGQDLVKKSPSPDKGLTIEKIVYDKLAEELNKGQRPAGMH